MKKKIIALALAIIMCLTFVISAAGADTLKRVPSTIPGTDRAYNYVENVTVKIPGTNATFDFEKIAESVVTDDEASYKIYINNQYIKGKLNIPTYCFYIIEKGGRVKFNTNVNCMEFIKGIYNGKYVMGEAHQTDINKNDTVQIRDDGSGFQYSYYKMRDAGPKNVMEINTIITSNNTCSDYVDTENDLEELSKTAVAKVSIRLVAPDVSKWYFADADVDLNYFDNSVKKLDISALDVNNTHDTEYKITDGANAVVNSDTKSLKITADGDFSKFTGVNVDGKAVDSSNYTASKGSTVVEFKGEYLKTLGEGEHTVEILFTDGKATTQLEVKKSGNPSSSDKTDKPSKPNVEIPNTDGTSSTVLDIFTVTALSGTALITYKKKRLRK